MDLKQPSSWFKSTKTSAPKECGYPDCQMTDLFRLKAVGVYSNLLDQNNPTWFCSDMCVQQLEAEHKNLERTSAQLKYKEVVNGKSIWTLISDDTKREIERISPFVKQGALLKANELEDDLPFADLQFEDLNFSEKVIGQGAYGDVFLATHVRTGQKLAVKQVSKALLEKKELTETIRREIHIHMQLKHQYICRLYSFLEDKDNFWLILEYIEQGSLFGLQRKNKTYIEDEAFYYFIQVVSGLYFLHENNYIHRDLKPENILITGQKQAKICDFGWCVQHARGQDSPRKTFCGTLEYMAPEMIVENSQGHDHHLDLWSLGILLYELLHGKAPYRGDLQTITKAQKYTEIKFKDGLSSSCQDLITKLLQYDPQRRLPLILIFEHPWIKDFQRKYKIQKVQTPVYKQYKPALKQPLYQSVNDSSHASEPENAYAFSGRMSPEWGNTRLVSKQKLFQRKNYNPEIDYSPKKDEQKSDEVDIVTEIAHLDIDHPSTERESKQRLVSKQSYPQSAREQLTRNNNNENIMDKIREQQRAKKDEIALSRETKIYDMCDEAEQQMMDIQMQLLASHHNTTNILNDQSLSYKDMNAINEEQQSFQTDFKQSQAAKTMRQQAIEDDSFNDLKAQNHLVDQTMVVGKQRKNLQQKYRGDLSVMNNETEQISFLMRDSFAEPSPKIHALTDNKVQHSSTSQNLPDNLTNDNQQYPTLSQNHSSNQTVLDLQKSYSQELSSKRSLTPNSLPHQEEQVDQNVFKQRSSKLEPQPQQKQHQYNNNAVRLLNPSLNRNRGSSHNSITNFTPRSIAKDLTQAKKQQMVSAKHEEIVKQIQTTKIVFSQSEEQESGSIIQKTGSKGFLKSSLHATTTVKTAQTQLMDSGPSKFKLGFVSNEQVTSPDKVASFKSPEFQSALQQQNQHHQQLIDASLEGSNRNEKSTQKYPQVRKLNLDSITGVVQHPEKPKSKKNKDKQNLQFEPLNCIQKDQQRITDLHKQSSTTRSKQQDYNRLSSQKKNTYSDNPGSLKESHRSQRLNQQISNLNYSYDYNAFKLDDGYIQDHLFKLNSERGALTPKNDCSSIINSIFSIFWCSREQPSVQSNNKNNNPNRQQ